jgi:phosphoribosyl 1,2-cyclic phosphodiesterase
MKVHILGSGSDGNATLVIDGDTVLLFDIGVGPRVLKQLLGRVDIKKEDISACFITHEHSDHISGLKNCSFPDLPVYASAATAYAAQSLYPVITKYSWRAQKIGTSVQVGSFSVQSFSTSHDSAASVAYMVESESGKRLLYCTDLGIGSPELQQAISVADYIILESNHCPDMLQTGPYPRFLKKRVHSKRGHLSNQQTAEILKNSLSKRTSWITLAHLSRTNNLPKLALETTSLALQGCLLLNPSLRLLTAPALATKQILSL